MDASVSFLEFGLNVDEVRKLNKMYFKSLYKERLRILFGFGLLCFICYDFFDIENDLIWWIIRNMIFVIIFFICQYSFVNSVYRLFFQLIKNLLRSEKFLAKYRFNFTNSLICVHSPLGEFVHKWTKIEKAILTKDFLFLYIKERNGYIISISNKKEDRNMQELIAFVESNVVHFMKI